MELPNIWCNEKCIEIVIDCIENVVERDTINISFIVEHDDNVLGESPSIKIEPNFDDPPPIHEINFTINYSVTIDDKSVVERLVSTPILIKAVNHTDNEGSTTVSTSEVKQKTKFTTKSVPPTAPKLLGICNLDLMPIFLGEKCLTKKLILEMPEFSYGVTSVSWQNLPILSVTIQQENVPFFPPNENINFINVTIESMYNLPGSFTANLEYKAGTILYTDNEIPNNIVFEDGTWEKYRDVERTKRWNSLWKVKNRARLSKYKLDCDFLGVKNEFKNMVNLSKKVCEDVPRIEWSSVTRNILWNAGIESMEQHIRKYSHWPFQFQLAEKGSDNAKDKSPKSQLYQCYVDLSELLFPGKNSTRVVTQLYTYSQSDIAEKGGLEKSIFVLEEQIKKETKEKDKKSKTAKSVQLESEIITSSTPVISENGEFTVIVIEVELYRPLIPCRIDEDFSLLIQDLLPKKKQKKVHYEFSADVAEEQYVKCVQKLVEIITESYRDFCQEKENAKENADFEKTNENDESEEKQKKYCYDPKQDELTCFTQYLYKTGMYLSLCNTLRLKVITLLDQKVKMPPNIVNFKDTQEFIALTYTYLVEQMHIAINKIVEGRYPDVLSGTVNSKELYLYADEAYELGNLEDAKHYYTTAITTNKGDSEAWTKYAIFLMKIRDEERARESCLEAIALNRRYRIALLIYAAILFKNRDYRDAEIFLRAVVDLYPRFAEGWTILHLFYTRTEYYPGIDLALRIAEKCMKDKNRDTEITDEPLAWTTIHCPQDSIYTITAIFLLKHQLCEFAEIALAREMLSAGRSTHVLYYMAVEHYLSGRYEDALSHLTEARCNYGLDYSISSLMGHCHYRMGDFAKAMEYYEFAYMLFDRPDNAHLVGLRMGLHYNTTGEYQRAKRIFLNACKYSPTSQTWFGAGISFYELNELEEAEEVLSEANRIDNRNADIWGYLCLLNLTLQRYDEFIQCYREMIKNNLKSKKLWLIITNSMEALGYAPPIVTESSESDSIIENYDTEESEEPLNVVNGT